MSALAGDVRVLAGMCTEIHCSGVQVPCLQLRACMQCFMIPKVFPYCCAIAM